jgi:hypothetical protein
MKENRPAFQVFFHVAAMHGHSRDHLLTPPDVAHLQRQELRDAKP